MSFRPKGVGAGMNAAADLWLGSQTIWRPRAAGYLAICAIFRDEAEWLPEWIEYHRVLGVERFFLYNNRSTDAARRVLQPYCRNGTVELFDLSFPDPFNRWQIKAINHALERSRGRFRWLASLDVDEFLVPKHADSLPEYLQKLESHPAVIVNWQIFGTSIVTNLPAGTCSVEVLTRKALPDYEENRLGKAIVQPDKVRRLKVHEPVLYDGLTAVNADGQPYRAGEIAIEQAQINHYWWRTESWFWRHKVPRREAYEKLTGGRVIPETEWRQRMTICNAVEDLAIQRFVPKLKQALNISVERPGARKVVTPYCA